MKTKLLAAVLFAGSALFAAPAVVVGVGVPAYAPPPPPIAYVAPVVRTGYAWGVGWRAGYWGRRPYARSYWVAPRYYGRGYYRGYWRR